MSELQKWLEGFVEFVRVNWRLEKDSIIRKMELDGYPKDDLDYGSQKEKLSNSKKCKFSEEFVQKRIIEIKDWTGPHYCTHRTKNSETPSDVWGIKNFGSTNGYYVHLFLIQVKSTQDRTKPKKLSRNDVAILKYFTDYVYDKYFNFDKPENISNNNHLVVSCGYAGIKILKKNSKNLILTNTEMYKYILEDRKSKENKRKITQQVNYIHKLGLK